MKLRWIRIRDCIVRRVSKCEKQIERDQSLPEGRRTNVRQGPVSRVVKRGKSGSEEGADVVEGGCRVKVGPMEDEWGKKRGRENTHRRRRSGSGVLSFGSNPLIISPLGKVKGDRGEGERKGTDLKLRTWRSPICS